MDPNIDTSRRKPRRTKGTPSFQYRNRFAAGVIALGVAAFGVFSLTPFFRKINDRIIKDFYTETEEERDKKYLFSMAAPRRGEFILKTMEEKKDMDVER